MCSFDPLVMLQCLERWGLTGAVEVQVSTDVANGILAAAEVPTVIEGPDDVQLVPCVSNAVLIRWRHEAILPPGKFAFVLNNRCYVLPVILLDPDAGRDGSSLSGWWPIGLPVRH